MERQKSQMKKSLIILFFLFCIPLIIGLIVKAGWFNKDLGEGEEETGIGGEEETKIEHLTEVNYWKDEPYYGDWSRANSSANPVRYEKKEYFYKYMTPTIDNKARIMCAGDLMCEPVMSRSVFHNDKFFFETCFAKVKKVFEASDFAIANLETSVAPDYPYAIDKHKLDDRYHCNAPVEYLEALRYAGLDAVTMANNHTCDTGVNGLKTTIENVEHSGILHTGAFTDGDKRYLIVDINGIKVAFLSYTEHFNSRLDEKCFTEEGRAAMLNLYSEERVKTDLKNAREDGAEFTVVYIHFWCKDYTHDVQESQLKCANEIAEAGADCIVGGHPHAVQKYDEIITSSGKRVPVNYCLGNFITSDSNMITRTSYIYELFLARNSNGEVYIADEKIIPCRVIEYLEKSAFVVFPTSAGWRNGEKSELLQKAEEEVKQYVGSKIDIDYNI